MKAEFTITQHVPNTRTLHVRGDLTAQWGTSFKEHLIQLQEMAMKKRKRIEIVISLEQVTSLDVSALQLLHIFRSLMHTIECPVTITQPESTSLVELIEKSGWKQILVTSHENKLNNTN